MGLVGMVDVDSWIARFEPAETFFNMRALFQYVHRRDQAKRVVRLFA